MTEVSASEALWLLEGAARGRLVYVQGAGALVRPAGHVLELGLLVVRASVQAVALSARSVVTYHVDEFAGADGGWAVSAEGPAEIVTNPDEGAHYRRTLTGWAHGPHDTIFRIRPQRVTGFRLTCDVEAAGAQLGGRR